MKTETVSRRDTAEFGNTGSSGAADITDAALVARVLDGDQNAFDPLVRRHQGFLFRYARSLGMDADAAADMVQDALVKAFERLESCRDPDRFGHWVGRILRNGCLDYQKSAARRSVPLPPSLPSNRDDPGLEAERSQLRSRLKAALAMLPDEQREAFLMKHGEGLSYEEIADLTGNSVSALKMRVHRARETLRDQLDIDLSGRM